jgi:hypothetical protein
MMIVQAKHTEEGITADIPEEVMPYVRGYSLLPDGTYNLDMDPAGEPFLTYYMADRKGKAQITRREKETAGITLTVPGMGSFNIPTGREDRAMMDGALSMLATEEGRIINWRAEDGTRIPVDYNMLRLINGAVWEYVEECFDRESEIAADPEEDMEAGWPSRTRTLGM